MNTFYTSEGRVDEISTANDETSEDVKPGFVIEAVVKFNDGEALVLNRKPIFVYEWRGNFLVAEDGPFISTFRYELPTKFDSAFGGRKFSIPMKDGSKIEADGQFWDVPVKGTAPAIISVKEDLRKCYVFCGCYAHPDKLKELRNSYSGNTYEYWDYETLICSKDRISAIYDMYHKEVSSLRNKIKKLSRDKKSLVTAIKSMSKKLAPKYEEKIRSKERR